jgi:hypothetical protein
MAAIWKGSLTFGLVNIPVERDRERLKEVAAGRKPAKPKKRKSA